MPGPKCREGPARLHRPCGVLPSRRMRFRSIAAAVLAVVAVLAPAGGAQAISTPTLQAKLAHEMRRTSTYSGVFVRDLDTNRVLFASKPDVARVPASVEKLYTTSAALLRYGPDATFKTTVAGQGFMDPDGVWRGNVYLRGSGDPTFSRADLQQLASGLAAAGIVRVDGSILGDESRFDLLRGSYGRGGSYDSGLGCGLTALAPGR